LSAVDPNLTLILPQFDQTLMTAWRGRRIFPHNATEEPLPPEPVQEMARPNGSETDKEVMTYDLNVRLVRTVLTGLVCRTLLKDDKESEKDHHDVVG
jgi:hypothetical protein